MILKTKRVFLWLLVCIIVLSLVSSYGVIADDIKNLDFEDFSFSQEIEIPIDTSLEEAKFQPIDIHVKFKNKCWAKDEKEHSVRVFYVDKFGYNEIESQIYDLKFDRGHYINSCNVVFLIPENINGNEDYYVVYDDIQTNPPNYIDHLTVEDCHYFYEPIPGQKADINYYKIVEDGYIPYVISYEGELVGEGVAQVISKLKKGSKELEVKNIEEFASFTMGYNTGLGAGHYAGTSWSKNPEKTVLIDGNLMVKVRVKSISPEGEIKTENIYTYYYCPCETKKRMDVSVNHEVLKTFDVGGKQIIDGTYAVLFSFKGRSGAIQKLNTGDILPFIHIYSEDNSIKEYESIQDPKSKEEEIVLSNNDDIDLGEKSWFCIDDPSTGKAHGLIFQNNKGIIEGEREGFQIIAFAEQTVKLPGLEADDFSIMVTRNHYEKGGTKEHTVSKGVNVSFNAEFVTFENGGYKSIDSESDFYRELSKVRPHSTSKNGSGEEKDVEFYNLTTYAHFATSIPYGNLFSILLGRNISYISAELYEYNEGLVSSGCMNRLPLCEISNFDFDGLTLFQKIKTVLGLLDFRNFSIFKKICFKNIPSGSYIVKIYRENPTFSEERQYIGYKIIDVNEDTTVHVNCGLEGKAEISILDQNEKGVENVRVFLLSDGAIIADAVSDQDGKAELKAPCKLTQPYTLRAVYKGFLIDEKKVTLGINNRFIPLETSYSIDLHQLKLSIKDKWNLPVSVDVSPRLESNKMIEPISIPVEMVSDGKYIFRNLLPAQYRLSMNYKSYDLEESIAVKQDQEIELVFPAEYKINLNVLNSIGMELPDGKVLLSRGGKSVSDTINENGKAIFYVPPGEYKLTISSNQNAIGKQNINVINDKKIDVFTNEGSFLHSLVIYLCSILILITLIVMFWKRKLFIGMKVLSIFILLIALFSPWWTMTGNNVTTESTVNAYLVPSKIVILVSSTDVIGGEFAVAPDEVPMVLNIAAILISIAIAIVFTDIVLKEKYHKLTISVNVAILSILSGLLLYLMSKITEVGVGSLFGEGEFRLLIPGTIELQTLQYSWGLGVGFYLGILSVILLVITLFQSKIKKRFSFLN
jgi:hypothetical protein